MEMLSVILNSSVLQIGVLVVTLVSIPMYMLYIDISNVKKNSPKAS